jgi:hypothetical protein
MKIFATLVIITFIAISCNNVHQPTRTLLNNTDSIAINFFTGDGKMDSVTAVSIIKDKVTIENIVQQATASIFTNKKTCGYDGSLHFFKSNRVVLDIWFKKNDPTCNAFEFTYNGKLVHTTLTSEMATMLHSFQKK